MQWMNWDKAGNRSWSTWRQGSVKALIDSDLKWLCSCQLRVILLKMHHQKEGNKLMLLTKLVLVFGLDKLSLQRQHGARKEFYQEKNTQLVSQVHWPISSNSPRTVWCPEIRNWSVSNGDSGQSCKSSTSNCEGSHLISLCTFKAVVQLVSIMGCPGMQVLQLMHSNLKIYCEIIFDSDDI